MRLAAERGQADAVQVMADLGADPNAADEAGRTALHQAAAEGYAHVVTQLLGLGADASRQDADGRTALDLAAAAGHEEAAEALRTAR